MGLKSDEESTRDVCYTDVHLSQSIHYKPVTLDNNVSEVEWRFSPALVCLWDQIFQRDGAVVCLDSSSEEECNWMMLVRPAGDHAHQNLSAYQQDDDVYFNTSQVASPSSQGPQVRCGLPAHTGWIFIL